ncbi:MAG: oxidoreductase [Mycobacterium sp.]|jgi:pyridoxine 4-dehydrogenase|uniref:oxidoreductase n=1 Tax=Mycobacterium sp. TaxID=1785 RepID=UPI003899A528
MGHRRSDSTGRQRTPGRYRLADKVVSRMGYGAMQLSGDGVFGPPRDRDEAVAVLRAAVDAGVDHIDTAQTYGAGGVNELIREALHPYHDGLALVSKVAARRDEAGALLTKDDPDQLRADIEENLTTLGVEQLTAVNLRVMANDVPDARFVDQLGALVRARDEGLIGGIGISNVTRGHLLRALEVTEIVCVQNFFNLADRNSLPILNECTVRNIAFVPFCPLGYPRAQREAILTNPAVAAVAARHDATAPQVALAWLLALAPNVLPIPGTRTCTHLAENLRACGLWLEDRDIASLDAAFPLPQ